MSHTHFSGLNSRAPLILGSSGSASSTTNSPTETNLAVVTIPAGLMGLNGRLYIEVMYKFTGTTNTKTYSIRHSTTSGDTTTGTQLASLAVASNALNAGLLIRPWWNTNSQSAQIGAGINGLAASVCVTGAINTANVSYINFNCLTADTSQTAQVVGYTVAFYPGV